MRAKKAALMIAVVVLVVLGSEASSTQAVGRLPFQVLLNPDGSGRIFMNNGTVPSWQSCRPDLTACTPFVTAGDFSTGNALPETVFWGGGELASPIWHGNLHQTGPPSVRGRVAGNEVVVPIAGQWAGGWASDYDNLSLSICKTAEGEHCLEINYEGEREDCGSLGATLIDPAFAGRYLRVVDRRYGSGTIFTGVGHSAYYPIGKIAPEATISMAVVGKIAPAAGPPTIDCGPPPLIDATIANDGSAEITCHVVGCRAMLIARRGPKTARVKRRLPPAPLSWSSSVRPAKLRLTPSELERLEGGPMSVVIKVNGRTVARRTVRVGPLPVVAEFEGKHAEKSSGRRRLKGTTRERKGSKTASF